MRKLLIPVALCLLALTSSAQQNYDVSTIPKELLPYASAVIRNQEERVEVKDAGEYITYCKTAITVFNKNGARHAAIFIWHNKLVSIQSVKGVIYDSFGKPTGKISESDLEDSYAANDFSLFEDSRVKHFSPAVTTYPYTVEYEYAVKNKQTLFFPDWSPVTYGVSVEKCSFAFVAKPDFKIRFKEFNITQPMETGTTRQGLKTYTWQLANMKAVRDEPLSPDEEKYLPIVRIAPQDFVYDGFKGSFTNWNELGKWISDDLLVNRDQLPPETVLYIKSLTDSIADPKQKARKIYEYMQQRTRYVSVQIGIGGYQPFRASDVDKNGYGDCKALVNYMHALLKTVNIDSYYCQVYSGSFKKSMLTDFASMDQGNHIILCIPFKNDTTWLECTSQRMPFGFLGDFTDDRLVLACTPEGGKLIHTPRYAPQLNRTTRTGSFTISNDGELTGHMKTIFAGTEFDSRDNCIDEPYKEQVKAIHEAYSINNLDIKKMELKKDKGPNPTTTENLEIEASEFANINSGKLYFTVNLADRHNYVPNEVRNRATDVYINRGYVDEDEFSYTLPGGYKPDKELINRVIEKPFGKYTVSMHLDGNKLTLKRRLQINDGTYSKDLYQDVIDFYETVSRVDNYSAVLVKNN